MKAAKDLPAMNASIDYSDDLLFSTRTKYSNDANQRWCMTVENKDSEGHFVLAAFH